MQATTSPRDLIATGKRRGGIAAQLATELELVQQQLSAAHARSGPEHLATEDLELAAWLASVAIASPDLDDPTEPLNWAAAVREELGALIAKYAGADGPRGRAEVLRIGADIADLCDREGGDPDLAAAILVCWDPYKAVR